MKGPGGLSPEDGGDPRDLLHYAGEAVRRGKKQGKQHYQYFSWMEYLAQRLRSGFSVIRLNISGRLLHAGSARTLTPPTPVVRC